MIRMRGMRKRRERSILWAAVLFLGLSFMTGYAAADLAVEKDKGTAKEGRGNKTKDSSDNGKEQIGKGKAGDACKIAEDCDQSSRTQRCIDSKCAPVRTHPVT
jgi:hypothetical protein